MVTQHVGEEDWSELTDHTPEARIAAHKKLQETRDKTVCSEHEITINSCRI